MNTTTPSPSHPTALEVTRARAGERPRFVAGDTRVDETRLAANLSAVKVEVDAPRAPLLARALGRLGVAERNIPLVTATPALRRSWLAAVLVALLFAINAASGSNAAGIERIVGFLTVAPLIPLLGVALAFGRGVDPTHEIVIAAPIDTYRVFLIRTASVLTISTAILLAASVLVPAGGLARVAWMLPAVAVTIATMALATRIEPRLAAGVIAATWITIVVVVSQAIDPAAMFGPTTQFLSSATRVAATIVFLRRRRRLDLISSGTYR